MVTSRPAARIDVRPLYDPRPHRASAYRHVTRKGGRWAAAVRVGGKLKHLGTAPTERGAAELAVAFLAGRYGPDWVERHRRAVSRADRRAVGYRHQWKTGGFSRDSAQRTFVAGDHA